jgi:hypothetical protein
MGIFLGRAVRAAMGAIVWGAVAVGMYGILRAMGLSGGPFDAAGEFGSVLAALLRAARAVIGGAGFSGLLFLVPGIPGAPAPDGLLLLGGAVVRLVEIVALAMVVAAVIRVIVVIYQGVEYSRLGRL